jgi:hypothetical protein
MGKIIKDKYPELDEEDQEQNKQNPHCPFPRQKNPASAMWSTAPGRELRRKVTENDRMSRSNNQPGGKRVIWLREPTLNIMRPAKQVEHVGSPPRCRA